MGEIIIDEQISLIRSLIGQENFDGAIRNCEKLIEEYPNNELGYYYRALCFFAQDRIEDSIKNYAQALQINPSFAKAYFNVGVSYFTLNYFDYALINFAKALVLFVKSNEANAKVRCINALKVVENRKKSEF